MTKLYQRLAQKMTVLNSFEDGDMDDLWVEYHRDEWEWLCNQLPSGSGIVGTKIDLDDLDYENPSVDRIVIEFSYHHMDTYGGYSGYSEWKVTVTPSLQYGINIDIELVSDDSEGWSGECFLEDRVSDGENPVCSACVKDGDAPDGCPMFGKLAEGDDGLKDYLHSTFQIALNDEVEYTREDK